jgi:hypothetical protein
MAASATRTDLLELLATKDLKIVELDEMWTTSIQEAAKYKAEVRKMKIEVREAQRRLIEVEQHTMFLMQQNTKMKVEFGLFFERMIKPSDPPVGDCIICAEPHSTKPCCVLPCGHAFHKMCAQKWCVEGDNGRECPLCRKHMATCVGMKRPLAAGAAEE